MIHYTRWRKWHKTNVFPGDGGCVFFIFRGINYAKHAVWWVDNYLKILCKSRKYWWELITNEWIGFHVFDVIIFLSAIEGYVSPMSVLKWNFFKENCASAWFNKEFFHRFWFCLIQSYSNPNYTFFWRRFINNLCKIV